MEGMSGTDGMSEMVRKLLYYPDRLPREMPPPHWAGACEEVWLSVPTAWRSTACGGRNRRERR
jgi:hypothetical protein